MLKDADLQLGEHNNSHVFILSGKLRIESYGLGVDRILHLLLPQVLLLEIK